MAESMPAPLQRIVLCQNSDDSLVERELGKIVQDVVFLSMDPVAGVAFFRAEIETQLALILVSQVPLSTNPDDPSSVLSIFTEASPTKLQLTEHNSKFYQFVGSCSNLGVNQLKIRIQCPISESELEACTPSSLEPFIFRETPEDYRSITKPYIDSLPSLRNEWIYNILEHKSEVDKILFEDPDLEQGFILLPDFKWDKKDVSKLYCLALVQRRDLLTLRDLNSSHLPLLKNLRNATTCLTTKFGLPDEQIRVLIHYMPSFFHLHIHYISTSFIPPDGSLIAGRAILLEDVIDNLNFASDYYQQMSLPLTIKKGYPTFSQFHNLHKSRSSALSS